MRTSTRYMVCWLALLIVVFALCQSPSVVAQEPAQQSLAPVMLPAAAVDAAAPSGGPVMVSLRELSPWSMFMSSSPVVQVVMAGLAFASLVTWTIFIAKFVELFIAKRKLAASLEIAAKTRTASEALSVLSSDQSVMRIFIVAAASEIKQSADLHIATGIKERAATSFSEISRAEARHIRFGMGLLATIAATSPFVGLFGTVWGIMNSFIGISKSQTTNLAVVAPGIAESLLATAVGLFAAIPAVVIYNHFSRVTKGYLELVNRAAGIASRQLSRDLDRLNTRAIQRAAE